MLALVIDRETSAEVSRINNHIGRSIYLHPPQQRLRRVPEERRLWNEFGKSYDQEQAKIALGQNAYYENLLIEYTQLKLYLHDLRKSCYYRGDPYCEREDINVTGIMDRCDELRQMIKEKRRIIRFAAWGGMEPAKETAYDKPLLYAFDEYTCSHITHQTLLLSGEITAEECPLKGEHWYHGKPFCRTHLGEARRQYKLENRRKRHRWVCKEEKCERKTPHYHEFGGVHYYGAQMPVRNS